MTHLAQPDLNGCHNRPPFKQTLIVQDGWTASGRRINKEIKHVMSTDCRHDKRATDPRCRGCKHI